MIVSFESQFFCFLQCLKNHYLLCSAIHSSYKRALTKHYPDAIRNKSVSNSRFAPMGWWGLGEEVEGINPIRGILALLAIRRTKTAWPHIGQSLTWIHFWTKHLALRIVCLMMKVRMGNCLKRSRSMERKFCRKMSTKHFGRWFLHGVISDPISLVPLAEYVILCNLRPPEMDNRSLIGGGWFIHLSYVRLISFESNLYKVYEFMNIFSPAPKLSGLGGKGG